MARYSTKRIKHTLGLRNYIYHRQNLAFNPARVRFLNPDRLYARLEEFDAHLFWGACRDEIQLFKGSVHALWYAMIPSDSADLFENHAVLLVSKSVRPSCPKARRRNHAFSIKNAGQTASRLPGRILPKFEESK